MNNDLSYLNTEYARNKSQESYDIEYHSRLSADPDTKTPDDNKSCMMRVAGSNPRPMQEGKE